jgi:hypothetical protein
MRNTLWLLAVAGWLLVGTWFVAPLLGLAIAFLLMVGIRGYAQAMILSWLIAGIARWVFLLTAGSCAYYRVWSREMGNWMQLLSYIRSSLLIFIIIFSLINSLWFKMFWMSSPPEPFSWLSLELVGEMGGISILRNIVLTLFYWLDFHSTLPSIFYFYYIIKFFIILIIFKFLFEKLHENDGQAQIWMLTWLIAVLLWLCSLIGLPYSANWKSVDERVVIYTYEIAWWLATVPIGWGCLILMKSTGS